ncbi:hypothetical protein [Pseudomonas sp. RGM2987]|uniref:hypothetical protein n=1 Tax=Pseudomonas sp. RGM2987 TaxID=2930090 RepID=UPI001FD64BE5|nr:hypothetical protein [Pseudomonas sp. RGM2987]MCJ8206157.1 hypothetical protein [Pseudomonas sp. RGM2987]
MASINKQQKRAKRAKAKARQIRISRTKAAVMPDLPEYEDPFFLEALQEEADQFPEDFLTLFYQMKDAEETGRVDMMVMMLSSLMIMINKQPDLLDNENAKDGVMAVKRLTETTLIDYRMWADDIDLGAAQRWLQDPKVQKDLETARASFKEALKILWDLDELDE